MAVEQFDELGEVGERAGQAVDLVNDNDINLSSFDVGQEPSQGRVVCRASGIAPVIVAGRRTCHDLIEPAPTTGD
jgi:hypothetical protein